ncbi:hypothetical protein VC87395_000533 [Vibrio paracholerae 87395]|nr:hypothetical protein VC87395_000533 [Vibrio paracholerae 87395]
MIPYAEALQKVTVTFFQSMSIIDEKVSSLLITQSSSINQQH